MAKVCVSLPGMLRPIAGATRLRVEGATAREAVEALFRQVPALRFALTEDDGSFRMHVLCFVGDSHTREKPALFDAPLRDGDEITFVQAISGGCPKR